MSTPPPAPADSRKLGGGVIATLIGLAALVIVIIQNRGDVTFKFLFLEITWPLWFYTAIVAVFGALVWLGLGIMRRHRRRQARRD